MNHVCNDTGCKNQMVVIDGNEKLYRYFCTLPFEKMTGSKGEMTIVMCINNPMRGNNFNEHSEFCSIHSGNLSVKKRVFKEPIDLRPVTRSYTRNLQELVSTGEEWKEEKNINKFESHTPGMFYVVCPCGIILIMKCSLSKV